MKQIIEEAGSPNYVETKKTDILPRLPLKGSIDLTYRCNNNCRHCWLRISSDAKEKKDELSFGQIKRIVDEARAMGCRRWSICGGEPMIRPDFPEIFDYITANSTPYSINTNGTLVTPEIARLFKRKGAKMVALYGATAEVHDTITRNPGSFELTMRGFAYLKEAGAGFITQLVPMKDNYYQFNKMVSLAESLSKHYRVGAAWLYLSSRRDSKINDEIKLQRLHPAEVVKLDEPDVCYEDRMKNEAIHSYCQGNNGEYLFSSCILSRRDFHVDPYGKMSFCRFIKDLSLCYDLRKGCFQDSWDNFIPSLTQKIKVTDEYKTNCGSCELKEHCKNCPVYSYLEHGCYSAKVDYLCEVAMQNKKYKENWRKNHRRYFRIADITLQIDSDLPFSENTLRPKFKYFEVDGPDEDTISIRHHFSLPDLDGKDLGKELYRRPPWAIYKKNNSWIYLGISPKRGDKRLHRIAIFNNDHTSARIYNEKHEVFKKGDMHSLTFFPSDQILLARILADRQGLYLHACGVNFKGKGFLFAGHSSAGKSTIARMLKVKAEILCDDRMIIRKWPDGFRIYGTWSHGDVPDVSNNFAPLRAILFLKKSKTNKLTLLTDKKQITKRLLACLIKPFVTADWWEKTLSVVDKISNEVPCYVLEFDKSDKAVDLLTRI